MTVAPSVIRVAEHAGHISGMVTDVVLAHPQRLPDIHTHLFTPAAGALCLGGIDELLVYHYNARTFLGANPSIDPNAFAALPLTERADRIWQWGFVETDPLDEGRRGVLTVLRALGIDVNARTLAEARTYFRDVDPATHLDNVLARAGVTEVVCTNDPFNEQERAFYLSGHEWDPRFSAALRLDTLLLNWPTACQALSGQLGYGSLSPILTAQSTTKGLRQFLVDWVTRLPRTRYMGFSLPPDFCWRGTSERDNTITTLLTTIVFPMAIELGLPIFVMPEPIRQVTPAWGPGGDVVGQCDPAQLVAMAAQNPNVRFWFTPLNFASQHAFSVMTCGLPNVMVWGVWWFNLVPGLTKIITAMRIELNGPNFWPFNSDARVLEQLIYKWSHFRAILADVLTAEYTRLFASGRQVTSEGIARTVAAYFDSARLMPPTVS